ncbi:MAG: hypothetical protein HYX28_08380 [Candidatus Koribacter versatilis]|uniref:Uncharacterized protein n=1 Tax=Candidatus Korobacter versatilis TaxID=658062 RepID=A0A932A9P9_9BACT|nr:hypothetical protein [Candidatus Koribacter versatilis]
MKRSALGPRATVLAALAFVLLLSSAAFALLGAFNVPYGGAFTLTPDATVPTNVLLEARGVGLAPFGNSSLGVRATFDTTVNPNTISGGQFVLTAANGDQAYGVITGGANTIDQYGFSRMRGNYRFTGGTGRFGGVRGSGTWTAISRTNEASKGLIQFSFNGTIGN